MSFDELDDVVEEESVVPDSDTEGIDLGFLLISQKKEKTSPTTCPYEVDESGVILFRGHDGKLKIPETPVHGRAN